jgi:hypothetical protein
MCDEAHMFEDKGMLGAMSAGSRIAVSVARYCEIQSSILLGHM